MDKVISGLKEQLSSIVTQYYFPVLSQKLDDHISFLGSVQKMQSNLLKHEKNLNKGKESLEIFVAYKNNLKSLVDAYASGQKPQDFDRLFPEFVSTIDDYTEKIPTRVSMAQGVDHFTLRPEDHVILKMTKAIKQMIYQLSKTPERIGNVIRKMVRKQQKPLRQWMHRIHLRNIAGFYLKERLAFRMKETLTEINHLICITAIPVWHADESINENIRLFLNGDKHTRIESPEIKQIDRTIAGITDDKKRIEKSLLAMVDETYDEFVTACQKAGTIQLSNHCFNKLRIRIRHLMLNRAVLNSEKGWNITRKGLFDDWGIDNELYHLLFSALKAYFETLNMIQSGLEHQIYPDLDRIRDFLLGSGQRIGIPDNVEDQMMTIAQERNAIRTSLSGKMLPEISDQMMNLDFAFHVKQFTDSIQKSIIKISNKRAISKINDYTKPFKSNYIHYVSPYDLISFESLPRIFIVADQVEISLDDRLKKIRNMVTELGQIAEFNLETSLEQTEGTFVSDNPAKIAAEGIDRSLERTDLIRKHCGAVMELIEEDLFTGLKMFIDDLVKFTDNSNIIEIRLRILRGKTAKHIHAVRQQMVDKGRQMIPFVFASVKKQYDYVGNRFRRITRKYGISTVSESITADLAGFLSDAHQSVHNLPAVYQRLFKIAPLQDQRFFVGRLSELEMLHHAYESWTKGQFSSTLISGEKGSGATSLINLFLDGLDVKTNVMRIKPDSTFCSEGELIAFLNDRLDQNIDELDGWAELLRRDQNKIIVLEDCQRLYLKKVNGFEALQKLNELIQMTGRGIFWILTFTEYAYQYLDKTLTISEYFRNVIKLGSFDDKAMFEIIDQRHKVSGFNIVYEPSKSDAVNKKFRNLSDEGKQVALQNAFFSELGRIAKGNTRLALTYWLQSIKEINGNAIIMKSLKDLNLSFLNSLSATKLFALGALVLHEMLSEDNFGKVLNISRVHARRILQPMFEDGVLLYENSYYMINPLLYRQIIDLLKNRNIIH